MTSQLILEDDKSGLLCCTLLVANAQKATFCPLSVLRSPLRSHFLPRVGNPIHYHQEVEAFHIPDLFRLSLELIL